MFCYEGVGEVGLALRSFQVGVHLNPADQELRLEDLDWARHLIQQVPYGPLIQFPAMILVQIFLSADSYFIRFELQNK
jgi:hypothetical protein